VAYCAAIFMAIGGRDRGVHHRLLGRLLLLLVGQLECR
jgi:hypothetical protein